MCEETRFVDRHFIDVDLDPETERNIRADERNATIDEMIETVRNAPRPLRPWSLLNRIARLRPS